MATNEKETKQDAATEELLKREPTPDEAREARDYQEQRASAGGYDSASLTEDQIKSTDDEAKGNRR